MLPVVHKYDFTKLLPRVVAFVKEQGDALSSDPSVPSTFTIRWLALAEHLYLDDLIDVCLGRLRGMTLGAAGAGHHDPWCRTLGGRVRVRRWRRPRGSEAPGPRDAR
jgi:hypothetical protein